MTKTSAVILSALAIIPFAACATARPTLPGVAPAPLSLTNVRGGIAASHVCDNWFVIENRTTIRKPVEWRASVSASVETIELAPGRIGGVPSDRLIELLDSAAPEIRVADGPWAPVTSSGVACFPPTAPPSAPSGPVRNAVVVMFDDRSTPVERTLAARRADAYLVGGRMAGDTAYYVLAARPDGRSDARTVEYRLRNLPIVKWVEVEGSR